MIQIIKITSKKPKLFIIATLSFLFVFILFTYTKTNYSITNKSNVLIKKNFINICKNKVESNNNDYEIAVWTMLTDDIYNYGLGAIKLLKSIQKNVKTTKFDSIVLELINKPIPNIVKVEIIRAGWKICQVERIAPRDEEKTHGRFRDQFTKLLLWNTTDYKANYYFDSDTIVIRNIDNLFNIYKKFDPNLHKIGCTMDIRNGWVAAFNMGVFAIKPNQTEYIRLMKLKDDTTFNYEMIMAEQGFLNVVYKNLWYEIGFENNANLAVYTMRRDFWDAKANFINVIHFTMSKPWGCSGEYKIPCDYWRLFNSSDGKNINSF